METGIRIHLTEFVRERPPVPSVFTMKLRKLLRTKRLEYAEQQVTHRPATAVRPCVLTRRFVSHKALDRVLILSFGTGESTVRVILEFYAAVSCLCYLAGLRASVNRVLTPESRPSAGQYHYG